MTKKELEKRIAELERRVAALEGPPPVVPVTYPPCYPVNPQNPLPWWQPIIY
jgi:hypothetical protein